MAQLSATSCIGLSVSPRIAMEIVGHATTINSYRHVRLEVTRQALDQPGGRFIDQEPAS